MASAAAVCKATIFLLAVAIFASVVSSASHPLTAAKATDHAISNEKSSLLPVHNDHDKGEMAEEAKAGGEPGSGTERTTSFVSAEEEGKMTGSHWGKARKLDDDDGDDSDDSDHDADSDHDHDSDSDSDHDHDHDHDSDSDHDQDSDTDSDDNSDDDDHSSKNERKNKHAAQGRKGAPGRG